MLLELFATLLVWMLQGFLFGIGFAIAVRIINHAWPVNVQR